MTEYDYSPEAYERYLATQNRVSNWVNEQTAYSRQYKSAVVPRSVSTPPVKDDYRPSSSRRESSSHHSSTHSSYYRPDHRRIDASHDAYGPSRQVVPISYIPSDAPPNAVHKMYNYTYDPRTREVVLPPPRPGETYVIIPPNGKRIEIVTDSETSVHTPSSRDSSRSPTKKDQPLLRRLFSGMSPPPRDSGYESSRSGSSSRRHRTRSY